MGGSLPPRSALAIRQVRGSQKSAVPRLGSDSFFPFQVSTRGSRGLFGDLNFHSGIIQVIGGYKTPTEFDASQGLLWWLLSVDNSACFYPCYPESRIVSYFLKLEAFRVCHFRMYPFAVLKGTPPKNT